MEDKVGENPAALRAAVFLLSAKTRRVVFKNPQAGRRLRWDSPFNRKAPNFDLWPDLDLTRGLILNS